MNKFCIIGDPHVTPKSLDKANALFNYIENIGLPTIILGDVFDTKEVLRGTCLNLVYNRLKNSKLQFIILVGNHDLFRLDEPQHSLEVLKELPNVRIIDKIEKHPKLPFIFFPYIHDKALVKQALIDYADPNAVVFGHFEVSGFDFGNGHLCEDGKITHEDFAGYKRVVSGHFHKLQQTGNFTYLGTPFSHSFGEANQDKVLGVYTLDDDNLALTPTEFPRHISTKIDMSKPNAEKKLQSYLAGNENNLVRIQLFGNPEDVVSLDKAKYLNYNIKWEDKSESSMDSVVNLDESLTNKSQFMEFAKNIKKADPELIELGLKILEAVGAK